MDFPPFIDPCIVQISKSGTVDDALGLLQAAPLKGIVPVNSSLRLFEALFKEGRHEVAPQLLSQSPANVQDHADVCEIFDKMKLEEPVAAALADGLLNLIFFCVLIALNLPIAFVIGLPE
jgi:hypothetical protein